MPANPLDLFAWMEHSEFGYALLIFLLFVIPRFFVTLGVPHALSAFALGLLCSLTSNAFVNDATIQLMASLGITSLFLYAGLEVNFDEIRQKRGVLAQHVGLVALTIVGLVVVLIASIQLDTRAAIILALAVLTPSAGFIIESLDAQPHTEAQGFWIRNKAIAAEILALAVLFVVVQSGSLWKLSGSILVMAGMLIILPISFKIFAKKVAPVAPHAEFGFLLMVAFMAAMVTKKLGAYYLVGAFIVGIVARRFEDMADAPDNRHDVMRSIKLFASFFTPIYFFQAGMAISLGDLSIGALAFGGLLFVTLAPLCIAKVMAHRRVSVKEDRAESFNIATNMLPNLVFGLVLADILRTKFATPPYVFGGLVIYTVAITALPAILARRTPRSKATNQMGAPIA